jgi:hypothetical protein
MASNGSDPTTSRPGASEALGVKEAGELKDDPGGRRIKSLNWLASRAARQHDALIVWAARGTGYPHRSLVAMTQSWSGPSRPSSGARTVPDRAPSAGAPAWIAVGCRVGRLRVSGIPEELEEARWTSLGVHPDGR